MQLEAGRLHDEWRTPMIKAVVTALGMLSIAGFASADDHLFEGLEHGLDPHSPAVEHSGPAPGQGSPFSGEDTHTPASLVVSGDEEEGIEAKPHANIKDREPK
jgi:hypothetical protein